MVTHTCFFVMRSQNVPTNDKNLAEMSFKKSSSNHNTENRLLKPTVWNHHLCLWVHLVLKQASFLPMKTSSFNHTNVFVDEQDCENLTLKKFPCELFLTWKHFTVVVKLLHVQLYICTLTPPPAFFLSPPTDPTFGHSSTSLHYLHTCTCKPCCWLKPYKEETRGRDRLLEQKHAHIHVDCT